MDTRTPLITATALSLLPEWELAMTAENKSPLTIKVYAGSARQYLTWTANQRAAPFELGTLNRWVADALASGRSGATARTRQLAIRRYAAWLLVIGQLGDDPFRGIKTPKVEPPVVQPLTEDELRALLATCDVADDAPGPAAPASTRRGDHPAHARNRDPQGRTRRARVRRR